MKALTLTQEQSTEIEALYQQSKWQAWEYLKAILIEAGTPSAKLLDKMWADLDQDQKRKAKPKRLRVWRSKATTGEEFDRVCSLYLQDRDAAFAMLKEILKAREKPATLIETVWQKVEAASLQCPKP